MLAVVLLQSLASLSVSFLIRVVVPSVCGSLSGKWHYTYDVRSVGLILSFSFLFDEHAYYDVMVVFLVYRHCSCLCRKFSHFILPALLVAIFLMSHRERRLNKPLQIWHLQDCLEIEENR